MRNPRPSVENYFFEDVAQITSINGKDGYLPLTRRIQRNGVLKRILETSPEASFQKILRKQLKAVEEFNRQCELFKRPKLEIQTLANEIEFFINHSEQSVPPTLGRSLGKRQRREDEQRDEFENSGFRCMYLLSLLPPPMRTLNLNQCYSVEVKLHFYNIQTEAQEARKKLVEGTMRYAINIARLYITEEIPYLDLVQEGIIGLMHAADRYDERRGHFQSYAGHWIKQRISRYVADHARVIRVPVHYGEEARELKRLYDRLLEENRGNIDYWRFFQEAGWLNAEDLDVLLKNPVYESLPPREEEIKQQLIEYQRLMDRHRRSKVDMRVISSADTLTLGEIIAVANRLEKANDEIPDLFQTFVELNWTKPSERELFDHALKYYEAELVQLKALEDARSHIRTKVANAFRKLETFYLIITPIYSLERTRIHFSKLEEKTSTNITEFLVDIDAALELDKQEIPKKQIKKLLSFLTERERDILDARFGLKDGIEHTLEQVGQIKGVSRERIRQIESKAIKKLRHPTRSQTIREYNTGGSFDSFSDISMRLRQQLLSTLNIHEEIQSVSREQMQIERQRIETLIRRYIPSGRKRLWRTDKQSGRADMFRDILLEIGRPAHYSDIHEKAIERIPEGMSFAKNATYTTLFYHRYFRAFGNATFGLVEWESIDESTSGHIVLQHCPMPLLPAKTYPTAFFESVFKGRELLKQNTLPASQFWAEMVAWAQQDSNPQDAFDAWYAAGLIARVDYIHNPNMTLHLTLSKDAKIMEARRLCIESICLRVLKMPELLLTIDRIAHPTLTNIQKVLFGDPRAGFDVPQRLIMLTALDVVQPLGDEWQLTDIGRRALEANPPQALPDFGEIVSFEPDDESTDDQAWEDDLDLMDL